MESLCGLWAWELTREARERQSSVNYLLGAPRVVRSVPREHDRLCFFQARYSPAPAARRGLCFLLARTGARQRRQRASQSGGA